MNVAAGVVDEAALATLDFGTVVGRIAALATCDPGKQTVLRLRPFGVREAAAAELTLVDDAVAFMQAGGDTSFAGVIDVTDALDRAEKGSALSADELRRIAHAERALAKAVVAVALARPIDGRRGAVELVSTDRSNGQPLLQLCRGAADTRPLIREIDQAIDDDGRVKDDATPELAKIRRQQRTLRDEVRERCAAIVRNPSTAKLLSEPVVTVRAGRYVVAVRKEFLGQFAGVVHDESASGLTAYVEPIATVETNNRLRGLEAAEAREVTRILGTLSTNVGRQGEQLRANAKLLGHLDSIAARARWALGVKATVPSLDSERVVRIVQGRHPLLRHEPVPLDVTIGEEFDVLIISGPNMGGKSVALKTIGLFCVLAYAGIPVPAAAGTHIGWFDHIACILGDEQSIAADLSSFSAHLQALHAAISRAGERSLILIDEIGGGTEPGAGAAIAQAWIEAALAGGARVIVTTHFTQLKVFAAQTARVANGSMLFDAETNEPTYHLAIGVPGQSLALRLARALGMKPTMIARAESLMGADARNLENAFESLARERDVLQRRQAELQAAIIDSRELEEKLRRELTRLDEDRRGFEARAAATLDKAVHEVRNELLEQARRSGEVAKHQARRVPAADETLAKTLSDIRQSLGLERPEPGHELKTNLSEGDTVFVRSFASHGTVSAVFDRDVLVTIGNIKAVVPKSEVLLDRTVSARAASSSSGSRAPEQSESALTEIDVRGMRVDEAVPLVDKALDSASLAGASELRIIHGKGTGQLGRGINDFLREHAQVQSTRRAEDRQGGSGVTIVTLK